MGGNKNNKIAVAEFGNNFYSQQDIDDFFRILMSTTGKNITKIPAKVIGANDNSNPSVQASLDIEYVMGLRTTIFNV